MCSPSASFNKGEQAAVLNSRLQNNRLHIVEKIKHNELSITDILLLPAASNETAVQPEREEARTDPT